MGCHSCRKKAPQNQKPNLENNEVNNNIPSSQNVQEKKNVFINSPKEYGENLLKCINIFFIFCSIQFKARFEYDKKKYQCYKE